MPCGCSKRQRPAVTTGSPARYGGCRYKYDHPFVVVPATGTMTRIRYVHKSHRKLTRTHFPFNKASIRFPLGSVHTGGRLDKATCFGMFHLSIGGQLQQKCDAVECAGAGVLQQRDPADTRGKLFELSRTVDTEFQAQLEQSRR